jgi:vitamin B12 transporter
VKKLNRICFLLGVLCVPIYPAYNQELRVDSANILLEEITIMATRIPENIRQLPRASRIISRIEIESAPAHDLAGLLEYIPDIDVRQRGPLGVQSDISLRGGTFDQFAVLINGINFSDPQTGHFQMDIPIPLAMIQRIEILSGSDVKSLGSNAFTGAVNIVTGIPTHKSINAGISGGQYGFYQTNLNARNRIGKWAYQSGLDWQKSDGYRDNTDFNNLIGFFQTGFYQKNYSLSLLAGALKKEFGANSFYTAKYPNQFERTGSAFTILQADHQGRLNLRQSLYYRLHSDEFALFRSNPPEWYTSPNYHLTQTIGAKSDAWFSTIIGKTGFGLEVRQESVWSTVLGNLVEDTKPVSGIEGFYYNHYGSRSHFTLSAEQQIITGRFKWNGGVVLHGYKAAGNYFRIYPGLDMSYSASQSLRGFISVNRAFRLPTFTELYYQSPTNAGNPDLMPETALHGELGAEYLSGGFAGKLIGFYRFAGQSIDWVRTADETIWHTENLGQIQTWGMETGFSYTPIASAGIFKIINRLNIGYRHYFQHHSVGSYFSLYVLDFLKWKMTSGFTIKVGKPFQLSTSFVYQERNGSYTSFNQDQQMIEVDYKPFAIVDLKLSYRYKWAILSAECTNLFNQEYFDLSSVPLPGAWYRAGIEINFEGKKR